MSEMKQATGWSKASHGFEGKPSIVGRNGNRKPVSVATFEREADRDLALAAPALLAACKVAEVAVAFLVDTTTSGVNRANARDWLAQISAAIALAESR